jgi:signal peptidase II
MTSLAGTRWAWVSLGVVAADQATKLLLQRSTVPGFSRAIIPGLLNLVHARNPGVAFSFLADNNSSWLRPALIVFSLLAVVLFAWMLFRNHAGVGAMRWGVAVVLGGAAGNLIDRLVDGAVTDFLDFHAGPWHWPAFNLADSAITIGAVLIFWEMLFGRRSSAASVGGGKRSNPE